MYIAAIECMHKVFPYWQVFLGDRMVIEYTVVLCSCDTHLVVKIICYIECYILVLQVFPYDTNVYV